MPRSRTPLAKAKALGTDTKHPERYRDRSEPHGKPLGGPSGFLTGGAVEAWQSFKSELPWLMESDRAIVEVCSIVRGRMMAGELMSAAAFSLLCIGLGKLGATPADRSKISVPDDGDEPDEFFGLN